MTSNNYYTILGVSSTCTSNDIRKAFLKLSRKLHPDKQVLASSTEEEKRKANDEFVQLKEAYDCLYDEEKRKKYDDDKRKASGRSSRSRGTTSSGGFSSASYRPSSNENTSNRYYYHQEQRQQGRPENQKSERERSKRQRKEWYRRQEEWRKRQQEAEQKSRHQQTQDEYRQQQAEHRYRQEQEARTRAQRQYQQQRQEEQWNGYRQHRDYQYHWTPKTFGKTQTGEDCKRCIQQGCYCYQHKHQDPNYQKKTTGSRTQSAGCAGAGSPSFGASFRASQKCSDYKPTKSQPSCLSFGLTKSNQPCMRCIRQGRFCYQHKDQDPFQKVFGQNTVDETGSFHFEEKANKPTPRHVPFGRRKDGKSCKRCEKLGRFCHQHVNQQHR